MSSGHFEALRQEVKKYKKDEEEKTVQIKDLREVLVPIRIQQSTGLLA